MPLRSAPDHEGQDAAPLAPGPYAGQPRLRVLVVGVEEPASLSSSSDDDDEGPAREAEEAPASESEHYARLFDKRLDPDAEPPAKRTRVEDHAFWDTHYASLFARSLRTLRPTP